MVYLARGRFRGGSSHFVPDLLANGNYKFHETILLVPVLCFCYLHNSNPVAFAVRQLSVLVILKEAGTTEMNFSVAIFPTWLDVAESRGHIAILISWARFDRFMLLLQAFQRLLDQVDQVGESSPINLNSIYMDDPKLIIVCRSTISG